MREWDDCTGGTHLYQCCSACFAVAEKGAADKNDIDKRLHGALQANPLGDQWLPPKKAPQVEGCHRSRPELIAGEAGLPLNASIGELG